MHKNMHPTKRVGFVNFSKIWTFLGNKKYFMTKHCLLVWYFYFFIFYFNLFNYFFYRGLFINHNKHVHFAREFTPEPHKHADIAKNNQTLN